MAGAARRALIADIRIGMAHALHYGFMSEANMLSFGLVAALYGLEDDQLLSSTGALGPFFLIESMAF